MNPIPKDSKEVRGRATLAKWIRRRGAALVEAAVVMPVMVSFLGMMVWFHSLYQTKETVLLDSRTKMLTYASHNCGTGADPAGGTPPPPDGADTGTGDADANAAKGQSGISKAMSLVFHVENKAATPGTARGAYEVASGWSQTLNSSSYCMCNEKRRGGSLSDLVSFGIGIVKNKAIF
ncbi:MAG TPA: TadE family protein [Polyangiaceae bacterium]|nr:TadE family protein [Polyangiaceae bacterium]